MKNKLNLLLAGLVVAGVVGCKQYDGGTATITPTPLQVRGDSVVFTADINLPADKYKSGLTYVARPELGNYQFTEGVIHLDDFPDARSQGVNKTLVFRAPYQPDQMNGEMLTIQQQFIKANGKVKDADEIESAAACCVQTPGLFMVNSEFMSTDLPDRVVEPQKLVSQFNFPQDVFLLDPSQISDEDVAMIREYLEDPNSAERIEIHGYASPEGPWNRNEMLSRKRAEVVKDLLQSKLAASGYTGDISSRIDIRINQTIEDWDGFTNLVTRNGATNQDEILLVARSNNDPDAKERELTRAAGGDIMNLEANLAPLRRTTLIVPCKVRCVSPEEVDSVAVAFIEGRADVEDLKSVYTQEEWLRAAQATKAASGKKSLLVAYYDTYPTDYRVYNEMGVDAIVGNLEIKVEEDEYKIHTDDFKLKVENDEWKLELASGAEISAEEDELKIKDGSSKAKFENDEYKIKEDNYKLKVENDELKLKDGDLKVKLEDDNSKLEQDNMKIKISHDENQMKIKDDGFVLKIDGEKMKVKEDGVTYRFEDYMNNTVAMDYLERYDIAMEHFERARDLFNEDNVVLSNLGAVYVSKQNLDEAKNHLIYSLELKETEQAHYNLAVVYSLQGDYNAAIQHYNQAGENTKFLYNRGLAKLLMGDYEGAGDDLRAFIGAHPAHAEAYYVLGILEARNGNNEGVSANLNKAFSLDESLRIRAAKDAEFSTYRISQDIDFAETE